MKKNLFTKMLVVAVAVAMLLSGCSNTASTQGGNETEKEENEGEEEMTDAEKAYQEYMAGLAKQGGKVTQLDAPEKGEEIAVIHTTMGDIKVKFFPEAAPKAVENFKTLAKDGYYDGIIFHRVISGFMIQGGDPTGTGMGGESCWGTEFEDEFSADLCNYRGALSMANAGMNTNGSQFFIVQADSVQEGYWDYMDSIIEQYGAENVLYNSQAGKLVKINYSDEAKAIYNEVGGTPHLDYAHTVFGQVFEGMDVVDSIASVATDANDKPADDVIIQSISLENY